MGCANSQSVSTSAEIINVRGQAAKGSPDFHDKYFLGVKLGRGSFAQVRACTKVQGDPTESAVKILGLKDEDTPEELSAKLQKAARDEVNVWQAIGNHQNCVRLCDSFYGNDFCYMVMEKCSTGLLQALKSTDLTERSLGNVFAQMLSGISHCHKVQVVHRDIKPDNFLCGGANGQEIKLADFGLSVRLPEQGKLSSNVGTAPFMCPEMLTSQCYDEKADVWAFGVVVYALLFGTFPYMPKNNNGEEMKKAIAGNINPPNFKPVGEGLLDPAALERSEDAVSMVKSLLNRNPEERPSAHQALGMTWMHSALQGTHMTGKDLPSLQPMLHSAAKIGAFEQRDPARVTNADVTLHMMQMDRHSRPLPPTPSSR